MENRIPPPLVATLFSLLMWFAALHLPGALELTIELRTGLALVVLVVGVAICLAGVLSFRRARTTVNPLKPETASALVSTGVYRYTRNPMYLGFAIALIAWSIFLGWPPALLGMLGFVMYMNLFQIGPEERALASLFGREFTQYCSQVRRWL
ncbi:Protein-S-isoprenylcysteine O-methyltransferase Ste14 [Pseudomonas sp. ok272]|uniref:methyltransferase family protein n=1 Tax=unclassified Pseudomonas TaxID=196821 RepID=UPI0008AE22CB|nr:MULTISPECIES: isoprenylcysteine carboxylmethyltransferase family protein [unclassified Pseudomonas]SEN48371.1 Protein-S-isoprenylcysteine O-methyltransferase Ste14 [Pseudomonas sp. ok272]SFN27805.1 Protein-S-isoprenylcysteine O-methyltransferase Ste14 [Pseudomonas sp. ok602]